jgi:TetR/AcrR family transcriptional regulator, transcriptional repressor for nem operon
MARPKSFDEEAVLARAVELFRARGYEATSLADLESHLGLGRQSLYNTFGDKQTLFHKALDHYRQTAGESMVEPLNRPEAGVEAVREFFRVTIRAMTGESPRSGSPTPSPSWRRTIPPPCSAATGLASSWSGGSAVRWGRRGSAGSWPATSTSTPSRRCW